MSALRLWQMLKARLPELLLLAAIMLYAGYTVYLGLFLGGRPAWMFEGKFLVLAFYLMAMIFCGVATLGFIFTILGIMTSRAKGEMINKRHVKTLGVCVLAIVLFSLSIPFPIGLGVAYQIAEMRRATWENR